MEGQQERLLGIQSRLERAEITLRQDVRHTQELLVRGVADMELEVQSLKSELTQLEQEFAHTVTRAKQVVGEYRAVMKHADLARLQNRIDVWGPERRMTREQFRKMLEE